jgi:CXXC motif containing zinc binding protein, eukaryotic
MGFTGKHPKSGAEFELDLSDDFADFDDDSNEPVGLYDVQSKFDRA